MGAGGSEAPGPRFPRRDGGGGRTAVVGIGSVLMGDDAAGPHLVKLLEARYELPPEVTLLDAGTPGPALVDLLRGYQRLILVDTVKVDVPAGSVRVFRREEILDRPPDLRLSPHDPGLGEALLAADLMGDGPQEVLLIGIVPGRVELGAPLSPSVAAALADAEGRVVEELIAMGLPPRRRHPPGEPDLWWERRRDG